MMKKYLTSVSDIYKKDDYLEHTFRTCFQNFLCDFLKSKDIKDIRIIHEPKRKVGFGAPDFRIVDSTDSIIGYIECKNITEDIENLTDSEQLKKYLSLSNNLILTNYIDFIYFKNNEIITSLSIAKKNELKNKNINIYEVDNFFDMLEIFFLTHSEKINTTKELSEKLAHRTKILNELVLESIEENKDEDKIDSNHFWRIYNNAFKPIDDALSIAEFSDMYAQIISFGCLFYRLSHIGNIKIENIAYDMPNYVHVPLLQDVFNHAEFNKWDSTIIWIVNEIINLLNNLDTNAINQSLSYKNRSILNVRADNLEDPFLFFYESFLNIYNKKMKVDRGVFYTPEALVSFMIRSTDEILKNKLNIKNGFLDTNIKILDFATGTGTFILALIESIYLTLEKKGNKGLFEKEVTDFILKNIFGFEFLAVPYIICHLRIQEYLESLNFEYNKNHKGQRAQVYLTNTLDKKSDENDYQSTILDEISKEFKYAHRVKSKEDILVIIGNPPYNVSSKNKTDFIESLMVKYKYEVKEKNLQPLSDDYIKFIRFAHDKIERSKKGIISIVTNNSYLDGVIHRGMRKELVKSFDEIYILNLFGNSNIGDTCEDGSKDENVFDIKQGVSIIFLIKTNEKKENENANIFYYGLQGLRKYKYDYLYKNDILKVAWTKLELEEPYYWFVPKDFSSKEEYEKGFSVGNIFNTNSVGVVTGHDDELIYFNSKEIKTEKLFNYRPFDIRYIEYDRKKIGRDRFKVMKNFIDKENIGIVFTRLLTSHEFNHCFITNVIADKCFISNRGKESSYIAPLYTYNEDTLFDKKPNFTDSFYEYLKNINLDEKTPEEILSYIYASLHSPTYRKKHYEYLKIDFPRVDFDVESAIFNKLVEHGNRLIELHTLKASFANSIVNFPVEKPDYKVSLVNYTGNKIYINNTTYFDNVSSEIYNFYIGGYKVIEKWLKERKKHNVTLSLDDINHFIKVCDVISETINIMSEIDNDINKKLY